jgi:hypothetical protein
MKTMLLAAGLAASTLIFAAPASAAISFTFDGGVNAPSLGYTVINDFNDSADLTGVAGSNSITGTDYQIKFPPADGNGAPPADSDGKSGYLSVLGGGSATITFTKPVSSFQFDWGSIDSYNELVINSNKESTTIDPGSMNFMNPANGNQVSPGTNGLFTVTGVPGETFTSITLTSSQNSFEIDNLATGVPEPANWALMIVGFGAIGAMSRRRRSLGAATA